LPTCSRRSRTGTRYRPRSHQPFALCCGGPDKDRRKRIGDIAARSLHDREVDALGSTASVSGEVQTRIDAAVSRCTRATPTRHARAYDPRHRRRRLITGAAVGAAVWYATRPTPPRIVQ
jgi:hypothetical protein